MLGLMMDMPLQISSILKHAVRNHPDREVVSARADGSVHRYTYTDTHRRASQLAYALERLGMKRSDRVGTLAWTDYRHLELYYGVSGSGGVCHTINPRLFKEQLVYIVNHAEDRWLFVDPMFIPIVEPIAADLTSVEAFVILCGETEMPNCALPNALCYETLIGDEPEVYDWPVFDERQASSLCYTSGTTGNPKGVLYSHRSTVLHALAGALPDVTGASVWDTVMPVVPMFHVSAWGVPYAAPMVGAKLVLPGPHMADGESLQRLIETEDVTYTLGVPTIWLALLQYLEKSGKGLGKLQRTNVGGAACPISIMREFKEKHGVETVHGWGMTETSPLGVLNTPVPGMEDLDQEQRYLIQAKQGHGIFGIEMRITDDDNNELPWDGESVGELKVRGPWVCSQYFKAENASSSHDEAGWFATGDVGCIDDKGFLRITDRTKDVIKSGGEWISSIELENVAVGHPGVAEAAVIGLPHPKWTERPLLVVVPKDKARLTKDSLLEFFEDKVASWWIPDDVAIVDELPHTATGKVQKLALRKLFADHVLAEREQRAR